jgi:hypothetical protein
MFGWKKKVDKARVGKCSGVLGRIACVVDSAVSRRLRSRTRVPAPFTTYAVAAPHIGFASLRRHNVTRRLVMTAAAAFRLGRNNLGSPPCHGVCVRCYGKCVKSGWFRSTERESGPASRFVLSFPYLHFISGFSTSWREYCLA